jgi:hypothetical protein
LSEKYCAGIFRTADNELYDSIFMENVAWKYFLMLVSQQVIPYFLTLSLKLFQFD